MTDKKMMLNAPKDGGLDLDALTSFANKANHAEDDASERAESASKAFKRPEPTIEQGRAVKTAPEPSKPAKRKKLAKEYRTANVNVRLTPAEAKKLQDKAGLVNLSVYIRKILSDQDVI